MRKTSDKKNLEIGYIKHEKIQDYLKEREDTQPKPIEKDVKITKDARGQFLVRIPKKVSDTMEITEQDSIMFHVSLPKVGSKEKPQLRIDLKR